MGNLSDSCADEEHAACRIITVVLSDLVDVLGGKWRFPIIFALYYSDFRFNELKRKLGTITSRALTQNLSDMEMNLLIKQKADTKEFQLTEYALTLKGIITAIHELMGVGSCEGKESDEIEKALLEAIQQIFSKLAGKWRILIMGYLLQNNSRFSDIKASITGLSSKELTRNLQALIASGLAEKKGDDNTFDIYSLTPEGRRFEPLIMAMIEWTLAHREQLKQEQ